MARHTDLTRLVRRVERHAVNQGSLPLSASNDTAIAPVEDDHLGVNLICYGNADLGVVVGREVEIHNYFGLRSLRVIAPVAN